MPNPNDRTTHDGKPIDWRTHAALLEAELLLGYRLTIVQGIGGASASGGTHVKGRAVDLTPYDYARKQKFMRQVGFAAWYRPRLVQGGKLTWNAHVHCVLVTADHDSIAPAAMSQITDYFNHRSGLVSNLPDNSWHPDPIPTYKWPGSAAALALEKKAALVLDKPKVPVKTSTGLRVDGIDLSHHNPATAPGLAAAAKQGVKYVYLKATEGTTVKDATYTARRDMVRDADMLVGAYHFARPDKDGKDGAAEARAFLAYAKPSAGDMLPVLDLEDAGGLSRAALTRWVGDFVAEVKRQVGSKPIVYTPFDLADNFGTLLWVARYSNANEAPKVPAPWKQWSMRQFSDGKYGKPNNIAGMNVDLNTLHDGADLDELRIPVKPKPAPAKPVEPTKPTLPMPAATQRAHTDPAWKGDRLAALADVANLPFGADGIKAVDCNFQWAWDDPRLTFPFQPGHGTAFCLHYATPGQDNFKYLVEAGTVRAMTPDELKRPILEWAAADVLNWRRGPDAASERPATYYEMVTEAVRLGVVICAELKSTAFGMPGPAAQVVQAAKKAGHPPWFMALYRVIPDAKGRVAEIVKAGGSCALIFGGNKVNRALYTVAAPTWPVKPTRVW